MLNFGANIPATFIAFGHPQEEGSYRGLLVKEEESDYDSLWATDRWIHVCFSYEKSSAMLRVVKVRIAYFEVIVPTTG